jgi:predicted ATPase/DNA-binding SARP family transcriptional activator
MSRLLLGRRLAAGDRQQPAHHRLHGADTSLACEDCSVSAARTAGSGSGEDSAAVRVEVLGPLRLVVGGSEIDVPGPKRRAVLALLARAEGKPVAVDDLLDAVWPSSAPDSGRAALQSHVSRLRGHLGREADRLETLGAGYRLALGEADLDASQARALLAQARQLADSDPAAALSRLRQARALWRGPILADLVHAEPIRAWAVALAEMGREIGDALVACAIAAGRTDDVVTLAMERLAEDPLREPAVLLLMRALAATGRERDALRAGYEYRRRLARETGLDPSPALRALEGEIATRASDVAGPSARGGGVAPGTRLVGRDADLTAVGDLLETERMVTVVGPGGVGKTRLALEIAQGSDDATTLLLAPVTDPAAVPHALAGVLDLHVTRGDILDACVALLKAGPGLLVIDNCEHLLGAVRPLAATLIDRCPELRILATSREPLGIAAEHRYRLTPLAVPASSDNLPALEASPAVAVFIDRANRARASFAPDHHQLAVVGDIVRRLDGMPLAIELAARRLSSLGIEDLSNRLDRSLDLLGDQTTPDARHRTLRATLQWSYDLLPDHERRLFRHLAVFPDGVTLATGEDIATDLQVPGDPAQALAHLVDASMIDAALDTWPPRYRMLETLRSFGLDRLVHEGEHTQAHERLLRWAVDLADWIHATSITDREAEADAALARELPNLRAAWRLARQRHDLDRAIALVRTLGNIVPWRELPEIWAWAEELIDEVPFDHPHAGTVLGAAATAAWIRGELGNAEDLARRGLNAASNDEGRWYCLQALSEAALLSGAHGAARDLAIEAAACYDRPTESYGIAALAAAYGGDIERARRLNHELAAVAAFPTLRAFHSYVTGEIDNVAGLGDRAEKHYARAVELARGSGASLVVGIASVGMLSLRADAGRIDEVLDGYRDLIDHWERQGSWNHQWTTLRNLARLLHSRGDTETAVFLETAADHAPDAPPVSDTSWAWSETQQAPTLDEDTAQRIRADAAASSRTEVLEVARGAVNRLQQRE